MGRGAFVVAVVRKKCHLLTLAVTGFVSAFPFPFILVLPDVSLLSAECAGWRHAEQVTPLGAVRAGCKMVGCGGSWG